MRPWRFADAYYAGLTGDRTALASRVYENILEEAEKAIPSAQRYFGIFSFNFSLLNILKISYISLNFRDRLAIFSLRTLQMPDPSLISGGCPSFGGECHQSVTEIKVTSCDVSWELPTESTLCLRS